MVSHVQTPRLQTALKRFHNDERGMQSIESVVILAIAAVVIVGIFWLWDKASIGGGTGVKGAIANLLSETFTTATSWITGWFGGAPAVS